MCVIRLNEGGPRNLPLNAMVEIEGPETFRLDELVCLYLTATGDQRKVISDPKALYYGIHVSERTPVPQDSAKPGAVRFQNWLADEKRGQKAA